MTEDKDIIEQRFGRLIVKNIFKENNTKFCQCLCDCGEVKNIRKADLVRNDHGKITSCGCYALEKISTLNMKHGKTKDKLFDTWMHMKQRCNNINHPAYINYGGRGIKVCEEWENDFIAFYNWAIENRYEEKLTLDRKNNDENYCPENCRWTTMKEQSNNKRNNIKVIYRNEEFSLCNILDKLNLMEKYNSIRSKIYRGFNFEDIIKIYLGVENENN